MTQDFTPVRYTVKDGVAVISLDEPTKLNPLSDRMRDGLAAAVKTAMTDPAIRCLILTGEGGNFTAGADVRQLALGGPPDPARSRRRIETLHGIIQDIVTGPKPVICAVEGAAFGAGLSFASASDFLIVSETARFGAAFGKIGLTADCGLIWTMPQRIGLSAARDLMFTGRRIDAAEALALGFADKKVDEGKALEAAFAKADEYAAIAPLAIAAMKSAFASGASSLLDVMNLEKNQQPMLSMSHDHHEGIAAFREKRPAKFEGR